MEDYKEKYEQALERAKDLHDNHTLGMPFIYETCEQIFPELKESEDERIRKWIKKELESKYVVNDIVNNKIADKAFAWLEKQDPKKHEEELENAYKCADEVQYRKGYEDAKREFLKQGEQNIVDKVEPKFKVGDYIINEHGFVMHIDGIDGNVYIYHNLNDTVERVYDITKTNKSCHLWTIKDAKDGDVLATDSWLYMFKYTNNKAIIQFHCTCPINGKPYRWSFLPDNSYLDIYIDANIHPATKEQRDLLFQKMKEAGYEWNTEKKELEKIEQKPAWSEEDEEIIKCLNNCLDELEEKNGWHYVYVNYKNVELNKIRNWLKSLKKKNERRIEL